MKRFWSIRNETGADSAEMNIYGTIGDDYWSDVAAKDFVDDLKSITAKTLTVRINSVGGSVFAGQAIYSALKRWPGQVITYVDGLAASIASVVAMAGDLVVMPRNAMMMIHNPWTITMGESKDLRKTADDMDKIRESLISVYEDKTGLSRERIGELLDAETWMTAEEAKDLGFVDEIDSAKQIAASVNGKIVCVGGQEFDLSAFGNLPEVLRAQNKGGARVTLTLEMLKNEHADLYAAVRKEGFDEGHAAGLAEGRNAATDEARESGIKAERERIKAIEDVAMPGHDDLVAKAKFDEPMSAEALAVEIVKAERQNRGAWLAKRQSDAATLNQVQPTSDSDKAVAKAEADQKIKNAFEQGFNSKRK